MKTSTKLSALMAISFILLTQTAMAAVKTVGICESLFAPRSQVEAARSDRKAKAGRAAFVLAAARREGRASVDITLLQNSGLIGIGESKGIRRAAVPLKGDNKPKLIKEEKTGPLFGPSGEGKIYGGRRYIEFPNSTLMPVHMADGTVRLWMFTRGVRTYKTGINRITGEISPRGYVSDVLMFEVKNNEAIFHNVFLDSAPELKFLFEDPRGIDPVVANGRMTFKLAGTDYSPHKPIEDNPANNPDVMNRYIDIDVSADGVPQKPAVDPVTKTPAFKDLSPAPMKKADGTYQEVDAKNATITRNRDGNVIVHTRLRPNFKDPDLLALFDGQPYEYALQAFVFKTEADFLSYNWADALLDLTGKATPSNVKGVTRPMIARELVRDSQLPEHLEVEAGRTDLRIKPGVKGIGNGTRVLVTRRVGDLLLTNDVYGAGEFITGVLTAKERANYPLADGADAPLRFDHEIRKIEQKTPSGVFTRRHYSMSVSIFTDSLMSRVSDYLPDVIQPRLEHELGKDSGILDLLHVYPMGIALVPVKGDKLIAVSDASLKDLESMRLRAEQDPASELQYRTTLKQVVDQHGLAMMKISGGSSDANTDLYDGNVKTLIREAKVFTRKAGGPFRKPKVT